MHPILIAGAVLAGLPVAVHLLMRPEPKRLPFPAVRFLLQKHKTNQRKLRLRHLALLALRVLLIGLFAATLYQPTVVSDALRLSAERPIAAVLVVDTSPSMGYLANDRTRLDDARDRALALLDDLPAGSPVAVVDPADPAPAWEPSAADARRRLEAMKAPRGGGPPVTAGLAAAYRLLAQADTPRQAGDPDPDAGPLPRLVAVFSDRTAASWDASRADALIERRNAVPPPAVAHLYADVGADRPVDVALLAADPQPQTAAEGQPVAVQATVRATGADVPEAAVVCKVDGERIGTALARLPAGTPVPVRFTVTNPPAGFHRVELALEAADRLPANNVRYATFRVGLARKILTIADDPEAAALWQLAHVTRGEFEAEVKTPAQAAAADFGGYEVVCLFGLADPAARLPTGDTLWDKVRKHVGRGGNVLVVPGRTAGPGYDAAADTLLPGTLVRVAERPTGAAWRLDDDAVRRHPLLAPFADWKRRENIDVVKNPRRAFRFWQADAPPDRVAVRYDGPSPDDQLPAVLDRIFPSGGKVLLLTVPLDVPADPTQSWHDYWETGESSWPVVFPNLLARHLAGDPAEANYNFATGRPLAVPLPRPADGRPPKLVLEGPGVTGPDAAPRVAERQADLRLTADQTLTAGNFVLRTDDRSWQTGFSLNPPPDEADLGRAPVEAIEAVLGPGSVLPADKELQYRELVEQRFDRPAELYPWLMLAVLGLLTLEGLVASRFYRSAG